MTCKFMKRSIFKKKKKKKKKSSYLSRVGSPPVPFTFPETWALYGELLLLTSAAEHHIMY
ncbi:mCG147211 [Mus musculus]|nr:mCG147211 [Mus musculus]